MFDEYMSPVPDFGWFSLRVMSCAGCRRPQILLAMGQADDDQPIVSLSKLAPQLRLPAYAIILREHEQRARVRKVFPTAGEYLLTAAQWDRVLASMLGRHACVGGAI